MSATPQPGTADARGKPIRVLQMLPGSNLLGGIETCIMNYYRHIDRERIQFDFVFHYAERGKIDDEIERLGGRIHYFSVREDLHVLRYRTALAHMLREHPEYAIMHGHMPGLAPLYFGVARRCGVTRRIAHSHVTATEPTPKGRVLRQVMRGIKHTANEYLACSAEAGRFMFGSRPFRIMRNAIDTTRFGFISEVRERTRAELGIAADTLLVGHVGRFNPQKNHVYLVEAFAHLHALRPGSMLLLAGEGPLEREVRQQVAGLGLADSVVFAGVRNDVEALYQAMDVFLLPSLFEGLGLVLVEAQCSGLPCVAATSTPRESAVSEGISYLPIDENPVVWAEHALAMADATRESRHAQADAIRAHGYDIATEARRLERFYLGLAGGLEPPGGTGHTQRVT